MLFLISLCLALGLSWYSAAFIKRRAALLYWLAAMISLLTVAGAHSGRPLWPILTNGPLATAIFAVVMYMAVLPRGGKAVKRLLPIRAELSIIASILTLGHNLAHGKNYFVTLLTQPDRLREKMLWAAVISLVLMTIMLPLFITSFPAVRRRMKAKKWKRLQRLAYGFYALVYVHVMLLARELGRWDNILIYSAVFLPYGVLRIRKALVKKCPMTIRMLTSVLSTGAVILVCILMPATRQAPSEPVTYVDGIHFGEGEGYVGVTQVAVTVSEGRIQSVIVISSEDDAPYVEEAKALIPAVLDAQHTYLDAVSGATYTSRAILEAIEDALN